MVCKRKGARVPACTPCKQPRCGGGGCCGGGGGGGEPAGGGASPTRSPDAGCCQGPEQPEQPLCPRPLLPLPKVPPPRLAGIVVRVGGNVPSSAQQQRECGDADCREPPENPCDCHKEPPPETPDINQLPPLPFCIIGLQVLA
ncbi:F-box/LRR-repeat protein 17 [Saguinus oedipus]|uniref:F-box/LRR-repeat protein 17 n=1 Tax=Saguinus oedipus TaxID=9490 RepID=A0ABQ9TPK5_SAGOE|nr:F-box/LRR-repeat protein 17 [Saguinus oedipus]